MSRLENRQKQLIFAIYFKRFMMANNRHTFSSYELIAISKEINKTLQLRLNSIQAITSLLSSYGLKDVLNKHSHSTRHVYWFSKPMCLNTFKVPNI